MDLGKKVTPPDNPKGPEWQAVPDKPHLEVTRQGQLRTIIDPDTGKAIKPIIVDIEIVDIDVC